MPELGTSIKETFPEGLLADKPQQTLERTYDGIFRRFFFFRPEGIAYKGPIFFNYRKLYKEGLKSVKEGKLTLTEIQQELSRTDGFAKLIGKVSKYLGPAETVRYLYHILLQRDPDPQGMIHYGGQLKGDKPFTQIIEDILNSDEIKQKYIAQLYRELLHREPDEGGTRDKFERMKREKLSVADIAREIRESEEYKKMYSD